jgi:fused signal recognition particle receptor
MFWRRKEQAPEEAVEEPIEPGEPAPAIDAEAAPAMTVARPRREPAGMGLRARPSGMGARLREIFGAGTTATDATWDEAEETLIAGDVGAETTLELVDAARRRMRDEGGRSGEDARRALATEIRDRLAASGSGRFELGPAPSVILFVGVNGTGKTTTIAKLAARLTTEGRSIALAAADTFRAAAIEQLRIWGEQIGVPVVAQRAGADPGAVAFDAVAAAESRNLDAVLVDTAGRLQNKQRLMDELAKIRRVIERRLPDQPRHVLLVLDATTGQNGLLQAEAFSREIGVTGIVLTKLDGTAKGGVALAVADRLGVPILFAGVGEELDALAPFEPEAFVEWLFAG